MASVTDPGVFSISTAVRDDVLVVTVSGEVDLSTAPELTRAIHLISAHTRRLVADLAGVTFLDSSGLNALVRGCHALEERGVGFVLVAEPDGPVRRLLDLTQLADVLHVVDSVEDAFADPHD